MLRIVRSSEGNLGALFLCKFINIAGNNSFMLNLLDMD